MNSSPRKIGGRWGLPSPEPEVTSHVVPDSEDFPRKKEGGARCTRIPLSTPRLGHDKDGYEKKGKSPSPSMRGEKTRL